MADYKESSGWCPHCLKKVIGRKEEASHTFWLLASVLTCGIFAVVWIISTFVKASKPFKCSVCGTPLQAFPATGNQVRGSGQFSGAINPAAKSSPSTLLIVGGVFAGLFFILFAASFVVNSVRSKRAESINANTARTPVVQTIATTPSPVTQKPRKRTKTKTKEQRIRAGVVEVTDENGDERPFAITCRLRLEQMEILTEQRFPKGIRVATFERCLELQGDAKMAAEEMAQFLESSRN